ncbi:unnamed protein product [Chrysodeixis includens]|uniref:Uncharacterized protein n=1 Tax=Chrysodeixis includens TaxID=689277 RepID=A0A9N8KZ56_CHRIL|nr:unnamed protein product [Chrysodeixis includens]
MSDQVGKVSEVAKELAERHMSSTDTSSKIQKELPKVGNAVKRGVYKAVRPAFQSNILFNGAEDEDDMDLETFKDSMHKFADDQKRNFDEMSQQLAEEGPTVVKAVIAGVSAFKDVMTGNLYNLADKPKKPPDLIEQAGKLVSEVASVMSDQVRKVSEVAKELAERHMSSTDTSSKIQKELPKVGNAVKRGV